ncbi:MAG: hypothetical protein IAG10_11745 [Planctomycetaceae bacterium]|nr:hypothetical protein [Planctomycetaceae bacterium]
MTQPGTVIIPPNLFRLLRTLIVSNLLMVGGIYGISVSLFGVGNWTIVACVGVVTLSTVLYLVAAVRGRPRVVLTSEGFVFEKPIGDETYRWPDIVGQFSVIKIGMSEAVAYKLTPECKARSGKKSNSWLAGYDAAVGGALPCSAAELAELLNEHKERSRDSAGPESES